MNDDVRDEDRELLERAEVAGAYTWGRWVSDHVVTAELRNLVPALAARVRELSAMVRAHQDEQQERCENRDCNLYPEMSLHHEGCDGQFCSHGYCQECGSELLEDDRAMAVPKEQQTP